MSDFSQTLLQDQYNSVLVSNVCPPDWVNPQPAGRYNLVIIGAGPAGLAAAQLAASSGATVALVEGSLIGGEGLNSGCVPSKSLIRTARAHADVYTAGRYGIHIPEMIHGDFDAAMTRLRKTRSHMSSRISVKRLTGMGVHVFLGKGRFTGRDSLEVAGQTLRFRRALIATGSRSIIPSIEGLLRVGFVTNETVYSLAQQPRRLAVIGAGPVGCEMAQAFCRLGSEVTLIERESQILPGEDGDGCRLLASALERDDIAVKLGAVVTHVRDGESAKTIYFQADGHGDQVTVDEILVCAGRTPNTSGLDLAAAGIEHTADRGIVIDDRLRTSNPKVYAAGDVCTTLRFAHVADAMAHIAVSNALLLGRERFSSLIIPRCIHTDPEIARVGLCADDAENRGWPVDTYTVPFHMVDRAMIDGDEDGLLKIHVRKGRDQIVGAAIIGRRAGDMISQITLAMVHKIGLHSIADVVYPYPTHVEAIHKAAQACRQANQSATLKQLWRHWLAWSR